MSKSIVTADKSASLSAIAKAVSENAGGATRQAAVIAAASGLVLSGGLAAQTVNTEQAKTVSQSTPVATQAPTKAASVEVKAPAKASAKKVQRAAVKPAAKRAVAPTLTAPAAAPAADQAPAQAAPAADVAASEAPAAKQAAPAADLAAPAAQAAPAFGAPAQADQASAPAASASGKGATIAAAARAQVGVSQDCVSLAANALAAVGINFRGWPAEFLSLGTTVPFAAAQPGDLLYYDNAGAGVPHIAVYIGNGQAVHGGWNHNQTVIGPAMLGSGPVAIRVA